MHRKTGVSQDESTTVMKGLITILVIAMDLYITNYMSVLLFAMCQAQLNNKLHAILHIWCFHFEIISYSDFLLTQH